MKKFITSLLLIAFVTMSIYAVSSTDIRTAVDNGDTALLETCAKELGIDTVFSYYGTSHTALTYALSQGKGIAFIDTILELGANPNSPGVSSAALTLAFTKSNQDAALKLINAGADVDYSFTYYGVGYTPLSYAIANSYSYSIIEAIVENGADVNGKGSSSTPIYYALTKSNHDALKLLLANGVDANFSFTYYGVGYTPLSYAIANSFTKDEIQQIIDLGVDVNGEGSSSSPLTFALTKRNYEALEMLLDKKVNVVKKFSYYGTEYAPVDYAKKYGVPAALVTKMEALEKTQQGSVIDVLASAVSEEFIKAYRSAVTAKDLDAIKKYVGLGVDVNTTINQYGTLYTGLSYALSIGNSEMTDLFFELGADVDTKGSSFSATYYALKDKNIAVFEKLVDNGVELNATVNIWGTIYTPLAYALSSEFPNDLIEKLIDKGADVNGTGSSFTPLYFALTKSNQEIVSLLIENGADLNGSINFYGTLYTPFSYMVMKKYPVEILQAAIDKGADIEASAGNTKPLTYALQNSDADAIFALLDAGASTDYKFSLYGMEYTPASYAKNSWYLSDDVKKRF